MKLAGIEVYRRALADARRRAERAYDAAFHANRVALRLAEVADNAGLSGARKEFLSREVAAVHCRAMDLERAAWTAWREIGELADLTGGKDGGGGNG